MHSKTIQKYQKLSIPALIKKATEVFNAFIRARDSDDQGNFTCIACGQFKPKAQLQAGHFFPAGQYGHLRYHEDNVHGECIHCNYYSGDHLLKFRANLIKKLGDSRLQDLERSAKVKGFKWDRFTLVDIIEKYKAKKN